MSSDLHYLSLDEVARRLKARKLSSVEATRAILDRIDKLDPRLKSYATVTTERALQDAARLDAETAAGKSRGTLHGVPIAVKDLCNTAGVPTAAGMAIHRQHVPARDATVVARLKQAGAVILGKLQMTEGAYGLHHPSVDPPVNPFNAAYWTGVSSSGSGVATAAGLCFASLGSHTGGSIRFPSTMNGLSGLKPTWGRVSRAGVFPLAESLDHVGPMCRSALDSAGKPRGDLTLFGDVHFPFDPAVADAARTPVERRNEGPRIEESYSLDERGIVEVVIKNLDAGYARTFRLSA